MEQISLDIKGSKYKIEFSKPQNGNSMFLIRLKGVVIAHGAILTLKCMN